MGIFQGFFAFGIFFGDRVYVWLAKHLNANPKSIFMLVTTVTIISMIVVFIRLVMRKGVRNEK